MGGSKADVVRESLHGAHRTNELKYWKFHSNIRFCFLPVQMIKSRNRLNREG